MIPWRIEACAARAVDGPMHAQEPETPPTVQLHLEQETVARLDDLREEGESYDELLNELISIYLATERGIIAGV